MTDTISIAQQIREAVIKMLVTAGSGHVAGALGQADMWAVLFFSGLLHFDPSHPDDPNRDRVILSAGHTCPGLYAALALRGLFPETELDSLRQFGSRLQGHPHKSFQPSSAANSQTSATKSPENLPGIENTAGPLGQGTSFAVGVALGVRKLWEAGDISRLPRIYCICGDGELEEGQVWEAFMAASKFKLNHLTFIIDRNGIQIDGLTETVMPLEPLKDKLAGFGLLPIEVDGHNHSSLESALRYDQAFQTKPVAIIMHTIPGKGVEFMEGKPLWHGKAPNLGETIEALKELRHD